MPQQLEDKAKSPLRVCNNFNYCNFRSRLIPGQEKRYCLSKSETCHFEDKVASPVFFFKYAI